MPKKGSDSGGRYRISTMCGRAAQKTRVGLVPFLSRPNWPKTA